MKKQYSILACLIISLYINANDFHRYIWANYEQFRGNTKQAQRWYDLISETPQQSVFTNKGYLHFLHEHGNHQRIVELMPKLEETFKTDPDVQLIFVIALRKTNQPQVADDKLLRLSHIFKFHPEIVFQTTETLVRRKELQNALALLDDYLNRAPRRPNNFIFHFLKAQIYMNMREFTQARSQIKQCLDAHPRFPQGWLLLAMLEEQSGQLEQAIKGYSSYLEMIGPNKQIEQHLLELVFKHKAAQRNQQVLHINKACLSKALLLFERKQYSTALQQINSCLSQNQNDNNTRLVKIQILTAMKNFDETVATIAAWIAQEPDNTTWYQAMHLLLRTNVPPNKVINALSAIHKQHPNALRPCLYLADLYTKEGNTEQVIHYHTKALELTDNQQMKARILYQLSMIHYEKGDYTTMLSFLDRIESMEHAYPPACNLHAFHCATKGKDLAKAQTLCDKARNNDKNNPHFLDTQSLIFYKQHNYEQAANLLKALNENEPHDFTIMIHLAKAYNKLGNTQQAHHMIQQAQQHAKSDYEKKKSATLVQRWNIKNEA